MWVKLNVDKRQNRTAYVRKESVVALEQEREVDGEVLTQVRLSNGASVLVRDDIDEVLKKIDA